MSYLHTLVDRILELSGAEFKIAAYMYRLLEQQAQVTTTIDALSRDTGVSGRQTQSALRSLAEKKILCVESRKSRDTRCKLPPGLLREDTDPSRGSGMSVPAPAQESNQTLPRPSLVAQAGPPATTSPTAPPQAAEVEPNISPASPSPPPHDHELIWKLDEVRQRVLKLMRPRRDITLQEFSMLLTSADGELDRLRARLQRLVQEESTFDNFNLLCSVVRARYLIR